MAPFDGVPPQTQQVVLAVAPKITAALSIVGSSYIIWDASGLRDKIIIGCGGTRRRRRKKWSRYCCSCCCTTTTTTTTEYCKRRTRKNSDVRRSSNKNRSRKNRKRNTYHRLMVGLSCCDLLMSTGLFMTTWPMPLGTENVWGAKGNTATCSAVGFIEQAGVSAVMYNASLSTYYLLRIRYNWTTHSLVKIEKYLLHPVPIIFGLATMIAGLVLGLYNSGLFDCWIAPFPQGCTESWRRMRRSNDDEDGETIDCVRGDNASLYQWVFDVIPKWLSVVVVTVNMVLTNLAVRKQELSTIRFSQPETVLYSNNNSNSNKSNNCNSSDNTSSEEDKHHRRPDHPNEESMKKEQNSATADGAIKSGSNNDHDDDGGGDDDDDDGMSSAFVRNTLKPTPVVAAATAAAARPTTSSFNRNAATTTNNSNNNSNDNTRKNRNKKQLKLKLKISQRLARQSYLYVGALYLTYVPVIVTRSFELVNGYVHYEMLLTIACLIPLQGFWNVIVYLRPRWVQNRRERLQNEENEQRKRRMQLYQEKQQEAEQDQRNQQQISTDDDRQDGHEHGGSIDEGQKQQQQQQQQQLRLSQLNSSASSNNNISSTHTTPIPSPIPQHPKGKIPTDDVSGTSLQQKSSKENIRDSTAPLVTTDGGGDGDSNDDYDFVAACSTVRTTSDSKDVVKNGDDHQEVEKTDVVEKESNDTSNYHQQTDDNNGGVSFARCLPGRGKDDNGHNIITIVPVTRFFLDVTSAVMEGDFDDPEEGEEEEHDDDDCGDDDDGGCGDGEDDEKDDENDVENEHLSSQDDGGEK